MLFNKDIYQPQHIEVKESPLHGRGVFAKNRITKGSLIEQAPVIFLSNDEKETLRFTKLFHYYFLLGNSEKQAAFAFGYASFYNHSPEANAFYTFSRKRNTLNIYAYQTIEAGYEITINYNGKPGDKSEVYFPNSDQS
ncbi:SET domain-containing protein-lysine N-methyltransferase [Pedobacter sp. LMG 31464]|uniref:SET domain-containing protein-lysine N-methyltransferase n=1 Tax=Pedobacter planticolens TaxID=2679964 RepID=A0A923DYS9_9SPHI|nr:SET domain-containing protein-lysine N-methyltransferase [Pedobacter planticolens]MBB2144474.1 SET domain-containing protein-lysine N-methyltransferase [Pedobacter planticolens]